MKITSQERQGTGRTVQVVRVDGYLDAHTFPDLESRLRSLIQEGHYNILLDFETLDYISSAGLGLLLGIHRCVTQEDGGLKITNMSDSLNKIFDVLGFTKILDICPDMETALKTF